MPLTTGPTSLLMQALQAKFANEQAQKDLRNQRYYKAAQGLVGGFTGAQGAALAQQQPQPGGGAPGTAPPAVAPEVPPPPPDPEAAETPEVLATPQVSNNVLSSPQTPGYGVDSSAFIGGGATDTSTDTGGDAGTDAGTEEGNGGFLDSLYSFLVDDVGGVAGDIGDVFGGLGGGDEDGGGTPAPATPAASSAPASSPEAPSYDGGGFLGRLYGGLAGTDAYQNATQRPYDQLLRMNQEAAAQKAATRKQQESLRQQQALDKMLRSPDGGLASPAQGISASEGSGLYNDTKLSALRMLQSAQPGAAGRDPYTYAHESRRGFHDANKAFAPEEDEPLTFEQELDRRRRMSQASAEGAKAGRGPEAPPLTPQQEAMREMLLTQAREQGRLVGSGRGAMMPTPIPGVSYPIRFPGASDAFSAEDSQMVTTLRGERSALSREALEITKHGNWAAPEDLARLPAIRSAIEKIDEQLRRMLANSWQKAQGLGGAAPTPAGSPLPPRGITPEEARAEIERRRAARGE